MKYTFPLAKLYSEFAEAREMQDTHVMAVAVRMAHHAEGKDFKRFLKDLEG